MLKSSTVRKGAWFWEGTGASVRCYRCFWNFEVCVPLLDKELDSCPGFELTGIRAVENTVAMSPWREGTLVLETQVSVPATLTVG